MTVKSSHWVRAFTVLLVVGVFLACGIRQDEFDCENAVSHLQQCCPGIDATAFYCRFDEGCDTTYPALGIAESECIRSRSCDALRQTGVCDRAAALPRGAMPSSTSSGAHVCLPPEPVPDAAPALECTAATDCAKGLVCCFSALAGPLTVCGPAPCASNFQVCKDAQECDSGQTCGPVASTNLLFCQVAADASAEAAGEADGAFEGATE